MRSSKVIIVAVAAILFGALSVPAANAQLAWGGSGGGGGKGGGGGFSFGSIGKSGFHGRHFSPGKGRFVGRGGFRHGRRYAGKFKSPRRLAWGYGYGWPVLAAPLSPSVVTEPKVELPPEPPRVAEWKIYRVGTPGGCRSERVNVPEGAVTVFRC